MYSTIKKKRKHRDGKGIPKRGLNRGRGQDEQEREINQNSIHLNAINNLLLYKLIKINAQIKYFYLKKNAGGSSSYS